MIDIHAHVTADVPAQIRRAELAQVTTTVLLSSTVHPERAETIDQVRSEFARLGDLVAGVPAADAAQAAADRELEAALSATPAAVAMYKVALHWPTERITTVTDAAARDPRIVGIGELTPPPDGAGQIEPVVRAVIDTAQGRPLPVLVHGFAPNTAGDLREYANVAARYPSVPIIIGAFGGLNSMLAVQMAMEMPNIYLDLSSALQVFVVAAALRELPERCLAGSNTPYGDVLAARSTIEAASIDPARRQRALHDNAADLFGLAL